MSSGLRTRLRDGALFFVVATVTFTVLGAVWGAVYPSMQLMVTAGHGAEIVPGTEDAGFRAFVYYLLGSGVLGIALAVWAFRSLRRGFSMMMWALTCVLFGAWWCIFVGRQVVSALSPDLDANSAEPGQVLEIINFISPWPAVLLAPTLAILTYWVGSIVLGEEDFAPARA